MYESPASLILGFHGCDKVIGEKILEGTVQHLRTSENSYDWLGHGIYFWENNPERALAFAQELKINPRKGKPIVKSPFVLGAVIDPGVCLNLLESKSLALVKQAFVDLEKVRKKANVPLPVNIPDAETGDLLRRELDCAVIEALHEQNLSSPEPPFDTVRGVFQEGAPLYPNSGFRAKNHIQICVRNPASIRGYFRLLSD